MRFSFILLFVLTKYIQVISSYPVRYRSLFKVIKLFHKFLSSGHPSKYNTGRGRPDRRLFLTLVHHCTNQRSKLVVLVSNNNIYVDIKLYFCFVYRSILKYRVIDVFGERTSELSCKF